MNLKFILESLFWVSLTIWTLVPGTKILWFDIESIPINGYDFTLVCMGFLYLLPLLTKSHSPRQLNSFTKNSYCPWHYYLPLITIIFLTYATLSALTGGLNDLDKKAMTYTLLLTAASFSVGYNVIAYQSISSLRPFLWKLTVYLAFIGVIYSLASFLSLSVGDVRSALNESEKGGDFGIVRVQGPLFGADDGYFVILPALAFSIQELIQNPTHRFFKLCISFTLMFTLMGLGSRGGLLSLALFILLIPFFLKNKKQALIAVLIIAITVGAAAGIVLSKANTDRLNSLEDSSRADTHITSFNIIQSRELELNIFGSGYGSYWAWYLPDNQDGSDAEGGRQYKIISTPYGPTLYHPHSTFLLLVVELGMYGLLYFAFLWHILAQLLFRSSQNGGLSFINCGIFASGLGMFFNFLIFREFTLSTIWWIFLFGILSLNSNLESYKPKIIGDVSIEKKNIA